MVYIFVRRHTLSTSILSFSFFLLGTSSLAPFFFKYHPHTTRIQNANTNVYTRDANAGGRALASSELPAIRIQMIGRLHFYKGKVCATFLASFVHRSYEPPFDRQPYRVSSPPRPPILSHVARSTFDGLLYLYLFVFT